MKHGTHAKRSAHRNRAIKAGSASTKVVTNKQEKKGKGFFASLFSIFKKTKSTDGPANENAAIAEELKNETTIQLEINNTPLEIEPSSVTIPDPIIQTEQEESVYKESIAYAAEDNQEKLNYTPTPETEDTTETYHNSEKITEAPLMTEFKEESNYSSTPQATAKHTKEPEEKKKKRGVIIPLLIISLIANGILALLLISKHQEVVKVVILKDQLMEEKEKVMSDLLKLKDEYSSLQTNDVELQKELEQKRAEIDNLIAQVKKHKNDAYIISKLRKETETLRKIMKHFVVEIDSLNTLNQTIIAEKNKVVENLNSQINKTTALEKDNSALLQTVTRGSVLKAMSIKAQGIRIKGGVKEVEVKHASRVEKIKVAFTLSENPIAKKGTKTIYTRIVRPDGKEVTISESDETNLISYNGTKGFFAEKKDIDYQNTEMSVDMLCGSPSGFVAGKYLIEIICDGTSIGQTQLVLK